MKLVHNIANICTLLGAASLIGAIIVKLFHIRVLGLVPFSFFNFANTCLLLAIALFIREHLLEYRNKGR
jgi:hypothetical protein